MSIDELRLALDAAEARAKRWGRVEDVAFWACMLSSGAILSDHLWVRFIAWLSLFAWVLTLALHSQALRAEHRAHAQWGDAFYGRARTR